MKILFDLQSYQSASRFRGIGRYSNSLMKAILRNNTEHDIHILLNDFIPDIVIDIREEYRDLISQHSIHTFTVPYPVNESNTFNHANINRAEILREYAISQLKPDIIHIFSLFEGWEDNVVVSIHNFDLDIPVSVTLHDLIPYHYQDYILISEEHKNWYYRKLNQLKRADIILSNSHYTKDDFNNFNKSYKGVIEYAGASYSDKFKEISISEFQKIKLLDKYNINKKIILTTGNLEYHKNLEAIICAFGLIPKKIRNDYQLVVVSKMDEYNYKKFQTIIKSCGLDAEDVILTGYISDDDLVVLYNMSYLFVLGSIAEGFGLPILEAMACGAPVLGSNITSIPEVIGLKEALFDPFSQKDISELIIKALMDEDFYKLLKNHSKIQVDKFSWDNAAIETLKAFEKNIVNNNKINTNKKLKLAVLSPLPPEKSGISKYTADLIVVLNKFYDIELVSNNSDLIEKNIKKNYKIVNIDYFKKNYSTYDRVLYHFGNSDFHKHMFQLIEDFPGVSVLHDFYLGGILEYMECTDYTLGIYNRELFYSHGYNSLKERYDKAKEAIVKYKYPCNLKLFHNSIGVISHSELTRSYINSWYSKSIDDNLIVIPLLRSEVKNNRSRSEILKKIKLPDNSFIFCSFGILSSNKFNDRIISAWIKSGLNKKSNCFLIFVGTNNEPKFSDKINSMISSNGLEESVKITGWVDDDLYFDYLSISDVAIQLRKVSLGESSAAALDCMNYGTATIVNKIGTMNELPDECVIKIDEEFTDNDLSNAMQELYNNDFLRNKYSNESRKIIQENHTPEKCARKYFDAIEYFYSYQYKNITNLLERIVDIDPHLNDNDMLLLSKSIYQNSVFKPGKKKILIDVSEIARNDIKTGIQRVVRSQILSLINSETIKNYQVEPVYLCNENGNFLYRYARTWTRYILDIPDIGITDDVVDVSSGDIFYGADLFPGLVSAADSGLYKKWRARGVIISFLVYDLLPVLKPKFFPPGAEEGHRRWLEAIITNSDLLLCISKAVSVELKEWILQSCNYLKITPNIDFIHLGADTMNSFPSKGLPENGERILDIIKLRKTLLMVGTIEPRKGHLQAINAFNLLIDEGYDINLIIVGKEGWKGIADQDRRTIPDIIEAINKNPYLNKNLFWINNASDEYLENIYNFSSCLLYPSEGEGFGLPLIEAAKYGIPILVRDLPVFREVAGDNASYFIDSNDPVILKSEIVKWIASSNNSEINSKNMKFLSWEQSTEMLIDKMFSFVNKI